MKAVVQRAKNSKCIVEGSVVGEINRGLVIFVGVDRSDDESSVENITSKIPKLRIFENQEGNLDKSLTDVDGEALVIPNFTLCADLSSGLRPNFQDAASPGRARELFELFVDKLSETVPTESGEFGAMMDVEVTNDGPVTLIVEG